MIYNLQVDSVNRKVINNKKKLKSGIITHYYNRSGGIDAIFPLTDRFTISGNIAATTDLINNSIGINDRNLAGTFALDYRSDLWQFKVSHLSIQENFNAEMGFIRRTNIRKTSTELEYAPRPKSKTSIRQYKYEFQYEYLTNQRNRLLENKFGALFRIEFQNSSRVEAGFSHNSEYIDEE